MPATPKADAACVAALRAAGAVILGKTVTTEFAATAAGRPESARPCPDARRIVERLGRGGGGSNGPAALVRRPPGP